MSGPFVDEGHRPELQADDGEEAGCLPVRERRRLVCLMNLGLLD